MANQRIRRSSMENLHLLDLEHWIRRDIDKPPPLPPSRHHQQRHNRLSVIEHSRTLYDMTRYENDPIYAQTPMFTTIPRTNYDFHPRRLIGAHVPPDIIRPLSTSSTSSTPSTPSTPQSANKSKSTDEEDEHDEDTPTDTEKSDDDDRPSDDDQSEESSSTNSDDNDDIIDDDDDDDDDDQKEGIVEQIFNRDKPK